LEFGSNGALTYTIHHRQKDEVIFLTYRIEAGMVITDQPTAPRQETTRYEITADGKLVLHYGGEASVFVRA